MKSRRLIVVSNRLPVTFELTGSGWNAQRSSGGLVSALLPIVRQNGGCWVGWTGTEHSSGVHEALGQCCDDLPGGSLVPVYLTESEKRLFYRGCSNEILWPLFHDLSSRCVFNPSYWTVYREVNEKFADAVEAIAHRGDFIWVHDYHLILLADALAARDLPVRTAYFHHIPFPSPDIFQKLPWRLQILRGLLKFHSLGFQTERDRANFVACLQRCLPEVNEQDLQDRVLVQAEGRVALAGTYPISVDFAGLSEQAAHADVAASAAAIKQRFGTSLVVGVDRLDYTKGIVERLQAFEFLLAAHPELRGRVTMAQITVPSREEIPEYARLKLSIENQVHRINSVYGTQSWMPVHHMYRSLPRTELLAWYRAADVALVTPLNDGMNLVAKEFCAARVDEAGVLVLSEFAGAARELSKGALVVNPYDYEGIANAIVRGLQMSGEEQQRRMRALRSRVAEYDVFRWANAILGSSRSWVAPRPGELPPGSVAAESRSFAVA